MNRFIVKPNMSVKQIIELGASSDLSDISGAFNEQQRKQFLRMVSLAENSIDEIPVAHSEIKGSLRNVLASIIWKPES